MLTNADIKKITAVVATKEDLAQSRFEFKADLTALERKFDEKFDKTIVLLDKLLERIEIMRLEYAAISTQLSRHEEWIKKIAEKTGVKLEY